MTAPEELGTAAAATAKPASIWEDFIDIFVSPSEVFERRRNSGFFLPLIVIVVVTLVISIAGRGAMQPIMDAEFARGIASAAKDNPNMTPEAMEKARAFSEKFITVLIGITTFVMPLLVGVVLWFAGKAVGATEDIGAACMVAVYSFIPRLLDGILRMVQALVLDPSTLNGQFRVALSPARFLNPDTSSQVAIALLGRIDVFTIWVTVLLAIGLSVVGRIPRSRAAIAAVIVWVVGSIPSIIGALRA